MKPQRIRRALRTGATIAAAGSLAVIGAIALANGAPAAAHAAPVAAAALGTCPPDGGMPPIDNGLPEYTDSSVAVYAGGDYLATGAAAESEGLLLVRGDATFDKSAGGIFNVGAVGVGSGIVPPGGTPMLQVGGTLDVVDPTRVDVGHNVPGGGAVTVGATASGVIETNGATVTQNLGQAAAMAPNADFQSVIVDASGSLASATDTGVTELSGARATFRGDRTTALQVFRITAAQLSAVTEVFFEDIAEATPIVVNVVGGTVAFSPTYFDLDGERVDDLASPNFGNAASQIMWNLVDATDVTIGGTSQVLGSFLAPVADATITASTNGRVHVGGDLTTSGVGNEQHNYPWIGGGPFDCGSASFDAAKVIVGDGANLVAADAVFTLQYRYEADGATVTGELLLPADGTTVEGPELPEGTVVTFDEVDIPEVDGVVWGTPDIAPETITIGEATATRVTVTNTADAVTPAGEGGGFSAAKAIEGDATDDVPAETTFTLAYSYELDGSAVEGELSLPADGTVVNGPQDLPAGTVVTFEEVDLPTIDGVEWGTPELSASTVTIADGENVEVTVTNTATAVTPTPTPGPGPSPSPAPSTPGAPGEGDLAETGFDGLVPVVAGGVALLLGTALVVAARRRRA